MPISAEDQSSCFFAKKNRVNWVVLRTEMARGGLLYLISALGPLVLLSHLRITQSKWTPYDS